MERVLKDAKKEGIKIMNCASSHYAEKFYISFGFKRIEEKTVPFFFSFFLGTKNFDKFTKNCKSLWGKKSS